MLQETKRVFFGMEIKAPWPEDLPQARLLDADHRHMTLAFLGAVDFMKLQEELLSFPKPSFKVGFAAKFDQCLFFPPKHPHVVAWHVEWLEKEADIIASYYTTLVDWLKEKGFSPDTRHGFLPHVTIARSPFNEKVWKKKFAPLPVVVQDIHLYESVGNLQYSPLWSYPLLPPYEEIEHTADLAFIVRGPSFDQLYNHAALALCFTFEPMIAFLQKREGFKQLEDVIVALNELVAHADQEIGCPFKAVSYHSTLETRENILQWEMIIDV
jgi:RNA 2',3'-cyclic 3'-phosphodiesterase